MYSHGGFERSSGCTLQFPSTELFPLHNFRNWDCRCQWAYSFGIGEVWWMIHIALNPIRGYLENLSLGRSWGFSDLPRRYLTGGQGHLNFHAAEYYLPGCLLMYSVQPIKLYSECACYIWPLWPRPCPICTAGQRRWPDTREWKSDHCPTDLMDFPDTQETILMNLPWKIY